MRGTIQWGVMTLSSVLQSSVGMEGNLGNRARKEGGKQSSVKEETADGDGAPEPGRS